jgi:gliding motility-associated lipoprotein GldD
MKTIPLFFYISACLLLFSVACNSTYTSKKKGYFHIPLPEHNYQPFDNPSFPYAFEYPVYARLMKDSTYFEDNPENEYWINVEFPDYKARLFLSYKQVGGKALFKNKQPDGTYRDSIGINRFDRMVNDAFNLTNKNDIVASSIEDSLMQTPLGLHGIFFNVGGNAATAHQFFLTDTSRHFLRGALYFEATPNADSIRPVQNFIRQDVFHLINTFRWKNLP